MTCQNVPREKKGSVAPCPILLLTVHLFSTRPRVKLYLWYFNSLPQILNILRFCFKLANWKGECKTDSEMLHTALVTCAHATWPYMGRGGKIVETPDVVVSPSFEQRCHVKAASLQRHCLCLAGRPLLGAWSWEQLCKSIFLCSGYGECLTSNMVCYYSCYLLSFFFFTSHFFT